MLSNEIMNYIARHARAGQVELAVTVRELVHNKAPACYEKLDANDIDVFLQPALFAWLTARRADIDPHQPIYSALPVAQRPLRFRVVADARGRAHLPGYGYLSGFDPLASAAVECAGDNMPFTSGGAHLHFRPAWYMHDGRIEATHDTDTFVRPFFAAECADPDRAGLVVDEGLRVAALCEQAIARMARRLPQMLDLLLLANRRIHFYRSDAPNSFATLSVHGTAFLNVSPNPTEIFFLDDFAHQGGHVVFNAATLDHGRYLRRDAATPLREIGADDADTRTLYAGFHGLFTYSMIVTVLSRCLNDGDFDAAARHEIRGRIAFYLLKFRTDLKNLARPGLLAPEGEYLYQGFRDCYERVLHACYEAVCGLDLSNQEYVFDYARFAKLNANRLH